MVFLGMLSRSSFQRHLSRPLHTSTPWHSTTDEPRVIIPVGLSARNHHDLPSFLDYASRAGLDPQSTVYVGTQYEYIVQSSLERLGISLKRVGGRSDYGIDLLGTWSVPSSPATLKVLLQCKARISKPSPSEIRELEGAFVGAPAGWRGAGVVALLVAQREATKGVREAIGRSRWPMGFVMCSHQGKILQILWNRKAESEGLLGVGVSLKYSDSDRYDREAVLTWQGKPLDYGAST